MSNADYKEARNHEIKHLLELGFVLIPLHGISPDGKCTCGNSECHSPGKHPFRQWKDRQNQVHTIEEVEKLFSHPWANVGVLTGEQSGNLFVVDYDGSDAEKNMLIHCEKYGCQSAIVKTGSGYHMYMRLPEGVLLGNSTRIFDNTDTRGYGGYVVAPPSRHINGASYKWMLGPDTMGIMEVPISFLKDLATRKAPTKAISESVYGQAAREDEILALLSTVEGKRNDTLNKAAFSLAQFYKTGIELSKFLCIIVGDSQRI